MDKLIQGNVKKAFEIMAFLYSYGATNPMGEDATIPYYAYYLDENCVIRHTSENKDKWLSYDEFSQLYQKRVNQDI